MTSIQDGCCAIKANKILALYDEMTTFYGLLDMFKPNESSHNRKTLSNLYSGGKWVRYFGSIQRKISNTSFNITGFIQPYYVMELLHQDDNDRHLFDLPPEIVMNYPDLQTEISTFKDVLLRIILYHGGTWILQLLQPVTVPISLGGNAESSQYSYPHSAIYSPGGATAETQASPLQNSSLSLSPELVELDGPTSSSSVEER